MGIVRAGVRCDIYSVAGVLLGAIGVRFSGLVINRRLSSIGEAKFQLSLLDARLNLLVPGMRYKLYHWKYGYLGTYIHNKADMDLDAGTVQITCNDQLVELTQTLAGFNYFFANQTVQTVITAIVAKAGWTAVYDAGTTFENISVDFQGDTILSAVDSIRKWVGGYFTIDGDRVLRFGMFKDLAAHYSLYGGFQYGAGAYFGDLSGIPAATVAILTSVKQATKALSAGFVPVVSSVKRLYDGSGIINRVIPRGAGTGLVQLDLKQSDRTYPTYPYAIQNYLNDDGATRTYYIEDTPSVTAYGRRVGIYPFLNIRPITNSDEDTKNAANTLYDIAVALIGRSKLPKDIFQLSCLWVPSVVIPGSVICVNYRGVVETDLGKKATVTLDYAPFFVTEVEQDYGNGGTPQARLTVSLTGEEVQTTIGVISSALDTVNKLQLRPVPSISYMSKGGPTTPIAPSENVSFYFYLDYGAMALNSVLVEFDVRPLRSAISVTADSAEVTPTTSAQDAVVPTTSTNSDNTYTSASGGSSGPTSAATNVGHDHHLLIQTGTGDGQLVYFNDLGGGAGQLESPGASGQAMGTTYTDLPHTHVVTISAHSHTVYLPGHIHTVTVPAHSHTVTIPAHSHDLTWGVVTDTIAPTGITVIVNGITITEISDAVTGTVIGASVDGSGTYLANILPVLLMSEWRDKRHLVEFRCTAGRGEVTPQILARVTVQP